MQFNYKDYFIFFEAINNKGRIFLSSDKLTYTIGFENIFDALNEESNNLLNFIYDYSKNFNLGFIDHRVWIHYLATSKIILSPQEEQFVSSTNFDDINIKIGRNGKSMNLNLFKEEFLENNRTQKKFKGLFPVKTTDTIKENLHIENDFYLASKKIVYYNTQIELLLSFMNCLFSTRKKFYIKKCDLCEKYYVADKADNHYCNRSKNYNNKVLTCSEIVAAMQKTYRYKTDYETINREFLNKINDLKGAVSKIKIDNYKNKYKKERDLKKLEYFKTGDLSILVNFIKNYESNNPFPDI